MFCQLCFAVDRQAASFHECSFEITQIPKTLKEQTYCVEMALVVISSPKKDVKMEHLQHFGWV